MWSYDIAHIRIMSSVHENCFMLSFWIQPWFKITFPWSPESKTYRVNLTLLSITRIVSHLQIKTFFLHIEYLVTASESRSGLMIDSKTRRFETEIKSGFCWISQRIYVRFVLSYSSTDDYEKKEADSSTPFNTILLIQQCWIWTLKNCYLSNVTISNLFFYFLSKADRLLKYSRTDRCREASKS